MRILVTGSSGFIGAHLCAGLSGAHVVVGLDRRPPTVRLDNVVHVTADLQEAGPVADLVRTANPEVIIHLAAQARVEPSFADPVATFGDNILATINLIRAGSAQGERLRTFVYTSSETVYGPAASYPTPEEARLNPQSPYAASKAAAELLVRSTFEGRAVVLRSGMCYGPGNDAHGQVVAKFIDQALRDEVIGFPAQLRPADHPTRDANFVSNFVDGARRAIEAEASGTFNIASGREISMPDLARTVVERAGAGRVEFSPTIRYQRGEEGLRTWLDISKARDAFGYSPRVDLNEGLDRTIRWMRTLAKT